ncbi:SDR family oxidoreductase [Streptococcus saliviloxodontae]|uniref:Uncharacterized protein YbjT (DUF2867 family) n=1 Tax=Streptococcus saliviloxodontae TaxID=1349416 RepID=A0ABS2PJB4_9STRE|nr:SDR family oxidoreductase [Streptococcus saliviloxodontae]MBM7635524.1 uncharacterized protein YbjT (DUF2867 family) [Streptococcus saliviloxodontae]
MTVLALTGVTGHLGGYVAKQLAEAGVSARHLARRPEKAAIFENASLYKASYEFSEGTVAALEGVDVLFMVSGHENPHRIEEHKSFIDSAKKAGVKHIIYTSFYNASADATFTLSRDHAETESYIKESGFAYTFVRDNFYMDFFVELCQVYGEIKGPAGQGKVSAVVRSDVAEVIVEILKNPIKWENQVLDMTGPKDLSLEEIAEQFSQLKGVSISYIEETVEEAYKSRQVWRAEDWQYDAWVSTYTAIASGEQAGVSGDIERVLGRKSRSLKEYLESQAK